MLCCLLGGLALLAARSRAFLLAGACAAAIVALVALHHGPLNQGAREGPYAAFTAASVCAGRASVLVPVF